MDVLCPICGEPWDNDCLHEEVEARNEANPPAPPLSTQGLFDHMRGIQPATYSTVAADFRKRGCKALDTAFGPITDCKPTDPERSAALAIVYELCGGDMDAAAAEIADAEFLGLL